MSNKLEVIGITKQILSKALEDNTYWTGPLAPMSKSKAKWLLSNPRIDDDDYFGVIGLENKTLIAFIYMIPDLVQIPNGELKKAYWIIHWWVASQYKNTVFSTYIYNEAVNLTGKQILIKAYTENVEAFYSKQPFTVFHTRPRCTLFFSLDTNTIVGRFPRLKPFRAIISVMDTGSYKLIKTLNLAKLKHKTKHLTYEYINELDEITWQFIQERSKQDLIYKTKDYVNWQLSSAQYVQTPLIKKHPYSSLETGMSNNIYIHNFKILKDNILIGFVAYTINFNECNIKYFLVKEDSDVNTCVDAFMDNFLATKSTFIFTDDEVVATAISKRFRSIFTYKVLKKALIHKKTTLDAESLTIQNCDGHFY